MVIIVNPNVVQFLWKRGIKQINKIMNKIYIQIKDITLILEMI